MAAPASDSFSKLTNPKLGGRPVSWSQAVFTANQPQLRLTDLNLCWNVQYIHTNPLEFLNDVIVCQGIFPKHMIVVYDVAYYKLVMYGFHIHGGIDGASHYVS
jgi:hypothetical protein